MKTTLVTAALLVFLFACAPPQQQNQELAPQLAPAPLACKALPDFPLQELQTGFTITKTQDGIEAWYSANLQGSTQLKFLFTDGRIIYSDGRNWANCRTEFYPRESMHTALVGTIESSLRRWITRSENASPEQTRLVLATISCTDAVLHSPSFGNNASFDDNNEYRLKQAADECRRRN